MFKAKGGHQILSGMKFQLIVGDIFLEWGQCPTGLRSRGSGPRSSLRL